MSRPHRCWLEQQTNSARVRVNRLVFHMDEANGSARVVRFGDFEADLQTGELHKSGVRVPLQGQPFQVCAILLSRSGELVTREELRQKVWPDDTFVDFDQALNTSIAKIRIALGDDANNPRFVETLPRRGYRFITPVDRPFSQAPLAAKRRFQIFRANTRWISVGATLLALLCAVGIWRFSRNRSEVPLPPIEVVPLAALPGFEVQPAFSPDGNQVAFALHSKENSGIYTVMAGGEKPLRLTSNSTDSFPRWSPDGRQIAFSRYSHEGIAIYLIPALGGTEHRLWSGTSTLPPGWTSGRSIDWSPDGKVRGLFGHPAGQSPRVDHFAFDCRFHHTTSYVAQKSESRLRPCFLARRLSGSFRPRHCSRCS